MVQGLKTAVIEGHDIGGTCVNRGCVPSKALLAASGRVRELQNGMHLKAMGIQVHLSILSIFERHICVAMCRLAQESRITHGMPARRAVLMPWQANAFTKADGRLISWLEVLNVWRRWVA